jgi:hypothetical protein
MVGIGGALGPRLRIAASAATTAVSNPLRVSREEEREDARDERVGAAVQDGSELAVILDGEGERKVALAQQPASGNVRHAALEHLGAARRKASIECAC